MNDACLLSSAKICPPKSNDVKEQREGFVGLVQRSDTNNNKQLASRSLTNSESMSGAVGIVDFWVASVAGAPQRPETHEQKSLEGQTSRTIGHGLWTRFRLFCLRQMDLQSMKQHQNKGDAIILIPIV